MADKKKVLYISYDSVLEPLSQSQVLPYIKGLASKYDIFLLTFDKENIGEEKLRHIAEQYGIKKIYSLRYHKRPTVPATCFDIACGIIKSLGIARKCDISLVHARSHVACAIALAMKKINGIPYIFDLRGLLADERVDSGDWNRNSFTYKLVKYCERAMIKSATAIVLLAQNGVGIVEGIVKNSKEKITVIPTCVDTSLFSPAEGRASDNKSLRFIYVGSLGTWYMVEEMLEFFKTAKSIIKDARLLILTQSEPSLAKKYIQNKGLDRESVEIRNEAYGDVPRYLRMSDISLFFIRPTFSKRLSCPTKFAESLSAGVPVITNSGIGDLDHFIKKYSVGMVLEGFREDKYKKAVTDMADILRDKNGARERCRKLALSNFSLDYGVREYAQIYGSIV